MVRRGFRAQTLILVSGVVLTCSASICAQQPSASPISTPIQTGKPYSSGDPAKPLPPPKPQSQSAVTFTDVTTESRVGFTRFPSYTSIKYLLEAMGGGVGMFDYDNDGLMDLFFTNGAMLKDPMNKGDTPDKRDAKFWNRLYRQKTDGTFEDVTERVGLKGEGYSMGVAVADFDNDGDRDLYVTGYLGNQLYQNNGDGTFSDVTRKAGVAAEGWSSSAGWFDYDRDGKLDLFVGRYVDWTFEAGAIYCGEIRPGYRAFCHPDNFRGATNILYRQKADGTFEDVSAKAGLVEPGKALGVAFGDFDEDGFVDIFVANDSVRQSLYRNKGDGTFEDVAVTSGAGYDENGRTYAGMGIDIGDYDNDGYMDVFITTLSTETYPLYRHDGDNKDLTFTYTTNSAGVGQITLLYSGWGTRFIDADNDGWRDLFVAQGHVLDTIEKTNPYLKHKQTPLLMRNTGKGFVNVSTSAGPAFLNAVNGRGAAFGDLNNDGQTDIAIATLDGAPVVLKNNGTKNRWLGIHLVGTKSNRDGIGARIKVVDDTGRQQIVDATTAGSYLSANDSRVVFGFGSTKSVKKIEVTWPSGNKQVINEPQLDRYITIREANAAKPNS